MIVGSKNDANEMNYEIEKTLEIAKEKMEKMDDEEFN